MLKSEESKSLMAKFKDNFIQQLRLNLTKKEAELHDIEAKMKLKLHENEI